ncbi:thioredoxin 1 [Grosmannia clavigera kw1407]|uniref:Thioredoxin 1 n=1 Tax=Grosmannia clavigera (strain kw1407 / UAMH 11150) TaxID=655863 RepID=F0XMS1_GROCL|nr:thioredoxin 1 [Grosmannia clavigera kw1407]EFX01245.1 thioredoxin 1 [Grosmannia clavigera kw1407]
MSDKVQHISSLAELNALFASTTYVAIDFTATWCGPCKSIAPIYSGLSTKHSIPNVLAFAKVDVDAAQDVAAKYGISAMPTFLFFKDGKQVGVNGQPSIRGADPRGLSAAAEKLASLAKAKAGQS